MGMAEYLGVQSVINESNYGKPFHKLGLKPYNYCCATHLLVEPHPQVSFGLVV